MNKSNLEYAFRRSIKQLNQRLDDCIKMRPQGFELPILELQEVVQHIQEFRKGIEWKVSPATTRHERQMRNKLRKLGIMPRSGAESA